jgi:guanosine-3',5'-bis(diphosphate) 3'-pyrophosphohydrolase
MNVGELVQKVCGYHETADVDMVTRAYEFSARCHSGQIRKSGEPYVVHPLAVAAIIADMRLDVPTVVTGLLHDTVEDTLATLDEIDGNFGAEVAQLVDGVTKISLLEAESPEAAEAQTLRKMFLASARDIRVLLVKLADRAHNMRTIEHLSSERQQAIAQQTLDLYAPLAHRLGIYWLKAEFEDLSFRVLHQREYREIADNLALRRLQRESYIAEVATIMAKRLRESGIEATVTGRSKSAYSIYQKMRKQGLHYDDVHDVVAFRVLVDSERDCYDALGIIHKGWHPVPGRFRDYLALPKANRYQSLHTTVIGPYGERMEVQIRTHEMHRVAEFGIAAHWKYKAPDAAAEQEEERFEWLHQLLDWQQHLDDPRKFLHTLKEDLFADEVVVFTPKGHQRTFVLGATVVDFAYGIHSEVGDHCAAARVNGQLVPLRYQLQPGDTVEVITTRDQRPSRDWLKFVKTPRARERIVASIKHEDRLRARALGRELVERDLERYGLGVEGLRNEGRLAGLLARFDRSDEDSLYESVGYGRLRTRQIIEFLEPERAEEEARRRIGFRGRLLGLIDRQRRAGGSGVVLRGGSEEIVRFGKCCQPLPGEQIVGFMTRGRGVTVHASECERLADMDPDRRVEVSWEKGARAARTVRLEVTARNQRGLLARMSQAITSSGVDISRAFVRTTGEGKAINVFEMTLSSDDELARVRRSLLRVPGVKQVQRLRT